MTERVFNFSAGPAVLPETVLKRAQRDFFALPGVGSSVLEIGHRGEAFAGILHDAETRLRSLLSIPDDYHVLFLQGGSRLQFSMVPMNLLRDTGDSSDYLLSGSWGVKAYKEASREGTVRVAWTGKETNFDRIPDQHQLEINQDARYFHFTSNETIQGVQFTDEPESNDVPLVCDASSDLLSRPIPINRYGLIYACAQKNAGPAGATVVILHDEVLERCARSLPGYLSYREHVQNKSLFNTPPTFAIYMISLVAGWLLDDIGDLKTMAGINRGKAEILYQVIDQSDGFYQGHARPDCRSTMNVTFRLNNPQLEKTFIEQATNERLCHLGGHRSVGGIRASIYNAMPLEGVVALRDFMINFLDRHG